MNTSRQSAWMKGLLYAEHNQLDEDCFIIDGEVEIDQIPFHSRNEQFQAQFYEGVIDYIEYKLDQRGEQLW
jgi:hypothetical protein